MSAVVIIATPFAASVYRDKASPGRDGCFILFVKSLWEMFDASGSILVVAWVWLLVVHGKSPFVSPVLISLASRQISL